jgi:molecular chaperone GrpE
MHHEVYMAKKAPEKEDIEEIKDSSQDGVDSIETPENQVETDVDDQNQDFESEEVDELIALKDENAALKDQFLRKTADFENYRKRMIREKQDTIKFGNQEILRDLVDIIDNFERALNSSVESKDFDSFYNGISMIEQQFTAMLATKYNLTKMTDTGAEYDPNCHEALMMEETDKVKSPTVMEIFQSGYMLHDRVLRPAKVKVGKPVAKAEKESAKEKNSAPQETEEGTEA